MPIPNSLNPADLRCEYLKNPLGIDVTAPRFNWRLEAGESDTRGRRQTAYQLLVASSEEVLRRNHSDLWDTGKVLSDQQLHIVYAGKRLKSEQRCYWKLRVWDEQSRASKWSAPAHWLMGFLQPEDWKGKWIGLEEAADPLFRDAKWLWHPEGNAVAGVGAETRAFRRSFALPLDRTLTKAHITLLTDNKFTLWVNGEKAADSGGYPNRADADISRWLHCGENSLAIEVTNELGTDTANPAGMLAELQLEFSQGKPLVISTDADWRVSKSVDSGWQTAPLEYPSWKPARVLGSYGMAPWGSTAQSDHRRLPARMLRREIEVLPRLERATVFMSGLGFSELYLNGKKVDNRIMDPTHSRYDKRAMYVCFDVTKYLQDGQNALGVILGNGRFFAPRVLLPVATPTFGYPKLLFQMRLEFADGSSRLVVSDANWKVTDQGPIRANSEFDGEEYDARIEQPGWDKTSFDDSKWQPVQLVSAPGGKLIAQMHEPMRVIETLKPVTIINPKPGVYVADFGQNLYGMVRIKLKGLRDTRVVIRTTFDRHPDGMIDMAPNRSALSTDVYTLKGDGLETWASRFRGQGMRYAEITGWPGVPTLNDLEMLVVHTDLEKVGAFSCSNELVNKIYANMHRTVRMQERGVPMDPDRDERQAWLSVSEMSSETEGYMYNVAAFYNSFLGECRIDQREDGCISDAGSYWAWAYTGDPCWPSVVTTNPWSNYRMYGDDRIITENYPMMNRWVRFLETRLDADFIYRRGTYSDWVDAYSMDGKMSDFGGTPRDLFATAYLYYNCTMLAKTADFLGEPKESAHFRVLAEKVGAAFNKAFFDPKNNCYLSQTQTSYVLPLAFGLVPEDHRKAVAENLVKDIMVKNKGHLTVGCPGMKWLMQTLTEIGRTDVAYTILTQTTRPSWGYMVAKDGTSIWERWDRDTRDPGMNGQSQTILSGYLGAWMYRSLAGIAYDPQKPGFKHIIMRPEPVGDLKWVKASFQSLYGLIESHWKIEGDTFHWQIRVPANCTATVHIPASKPSEVTEGGHPLVAVPEVKLLRLADGAVVCELPSGRYDFRARRAGK